MAAATQFFKQKEPQSCKPRLKIFVEFGTQLKTLRKSAFMQQIFGNQSKMTQKLD
jgi:hypothetical protein